MSARRERDNLVTPDADISAEGRFIFHPERPFDEEVARYMAFDPTVSEEDARWILSGLVASKARQKAFGEALARGNYSGDVNFGVLRSRNFLEEDDYTEEDAAADREILAQQAAARQGAKT